MNKTHQDQWIIDYVSSSKETPNEKVISIWAVMQSMQTKSINFYMAGNQKCLLW